MADVLTARFPARAGDSGQIVFAARGGVRSATVQSRVQQLLTDVSRVPEVASIASPYAKSGASQIARDGSVAYATVQFDRHESDIATSTKDAIRTLVDRANAAEIDGEILGKPLTHERAHQQLARASGQTLVFHTGLALLDSRTGECRSEVVDFQVRFRPLDAATIDRYLLAEQPYDCAGSFKAEGLGIALFDAMQGEDPTSLIGLPLIRLAALLREAGLQVP